MTLLHLYERIELSACGHKEVLERCNKVAVIEQITYTCTYVLGKQVMAKYQKQFNGNAKFDISI